MGTFQNLFFQSSEQKVRGFSSCSCGVSYPFCSLSGLRCHNHFIWNTTALKAMKKWPWAYLCSILLLCGRQAVWTWMGGLIIGPPPPQLNVPNISAAFTDTVFFSVPSQRFPSLLRPTDPRSSLCVCVCLFDPDDTGFSLPFPLLLKLGSSHSSPYQCGDNSVGST